MSERSPNYDRVADRYHLRYRQGGGAELEALVRRVLGGAQAEDVLEVGCGSGYWLSLATRSGRPYGLDRSSGMLRRARVAATAAQLTQGEASHLPYPPGRFSLLLCVHALHHFPDPVQFLHEARRVLRGGGHLLVVGHDPHDPELAWYVYEHFPSVRPRDRRRYPAWEQLAQWLLGLGFVVQEGGIAQKIRESYRGREVLEDPYLSAAACSQLALLSAAEYEAGMARLRRAAEGPEPKEFPVRIDLRYVLATAVAEEA